MKKLIGFMFLFLSLSLAQTLAQKPSSYEGRHFFVGFMQNENLIENPFWGIDLFIYISCRDTASVTFIEADKDTFYYKLAPNKMHVYSLPEEFENRISEMPRKNLIEIVSDMPLVVYAYSSQRATSEAYAVIPVDYWGTEYQVMSYPNDQYFLGNHDSLLYEDSLYYYTPRSGEFMLMASEMNTTVWFTPKAITREGKQADREYNVTLNTGECYLVQSHLAPRYMADISGTTIRSDKPIGVLSGHVRTAVPQIEALGVDSKNHLVEMLPPQKSWGKQFITLPFSITGAVSSALYRIVAAEPNTTISYKNSLGENTFQLAKPGDVYTINKIDYATVWTADKPIQIAQYIRHNVSYSGDSPLYDPAMVIASPLEQSVQRTFFTTAGRLQGWDNFREHKVSLILNKEALNHIKLDGKLIKEKYRFDEITGMPYYYVNIPVDTGTHEILTEYGSFIAYCYGTGNKDAYAMSLGASLNNPFLQDTIAPKYTADTLCNEISGKFYDPKGLRSTGIFYVAINPEKTYNFNYDVGPVTDTVDFVTFRAWPKDLSKDGAIQFEAFDKNGNKVIYFYQYLALKVFVEGDLDFGKVKWRDSVCKDIKIVNMSPLRYYTLDSAKIFTDSRLKYYVQNGKKLPVSLAPYDSVIIKVCFTPNKTSDSLNAYLHLYFECDSVKIIPAVAELLTLSFYGENLDFGNVLLNERKQGNVLLINDGGLSVTIDSIAVADSVDFIYSPMSFPRILNGGDTLVVPVEFEPTERKLYIDDLLAYSADVSEPAKAKVKGRGVAPIVNSIVIDWGRRRAGTTNDTFAVFTNTGNWEAEFSHSTFITKSGDDELAAQAANIAFKLEADGKDSVLLSYKPEQRQTLNIESYLQENIWSHSDSITLKLIGQSVMPGIALFDANFGKIFVDSSATKNHKAILSNGNEALKIYSMEADSGDISAFNADFEAVVDEIVNVDDSLNLNIEFKPKRLGLHKMRVNVLHDAGEYIGDVPPVISSYFYVIAEAIRRDTISIMTSITGPASITACNTAEMTFTVRNTGNVKIAVNDIQLNDKNLISNWITKPLIPDTLVPGANRSYRISVLALYGSGAEVEVTVKYNDSLSQTETLRLNIISAPLKLELVTKYEVEPGNNIFMDFNGSFPNGINTSAAFKLEVEYEKNFLFLTDKTTILTIEDNQGVRNYNINVQDDEGKITLTPSQKLTLGKDAKWKLRLKFLALLDTVRDSKMTVQAYMDECFEPGTAEIPLNIIDICTFDLRSVEFNANLYTMQLAPNPASEILNLKVYSPGEKAVDINLIDQNGKKITLFDNLNLKKGEHYLTYVIDNVPNGVYVLSMNADDFVKNIIFVIKK